METEKEFYSNLSDEDLFYIIQFTIGGVYASNKTGLQNGITKIQKRAFKLGKDEMYLRGRVDEFIEMMK